MWRKLLSQPEALLVLTFAGLILLGTAALCLPVAHTDRPVTGLDAFFTATSAVCVTGLITVDTQYAYSRFGQTVILVLIQLGGLGVMTFGAFAVQVFQRRVSFSSQAALQDVFFQGRTAIDLKNALQKIVLMTVLLESAGAILLRGGLAATGKPTPTFDAVFLSVSAFCNAGFSVYSDSLMSVADSQVVLWTIMFLIVAGGLGYTVLLELVERFWLLLRRRRPAPVCWSLNSRIVLAVSGVLIVCGGLALAVTGLGTQPDAQGGAPLHFLFQSVTTRTAGFNTVDIGRLPLPSLMIMIPLMFVGGSPGSCAGGIKTTSAMVWAARVWARLTGRDRVNVGNRRIPSDVVRRAGLVIAIAALWNSAGVMVLVNTESGAAERGPGSTSKVAEEALHFDHIIFEQISAFGTVGLSAGLTPRLSTFGKLWIIASMFVGRLGPLTIAFALMKRPRVSYAYPEERVMIG